MRDSCQPRVAGFGRDDVGNAFLNDVQLGATGNFPEGNRDLDFAGQGRVFEFVGVTKALVRDEFEVSSAEGVALAGGEIGEGHFVGYRRLWGRYGGLCR